jgi:hypothetical protein
MQPGTKQRLLSISNVERGRIFVLTRLLLGFISWSVL